MPPKQTTKYVNKKRVRMPPEIERGTTEFRATQAQRDKRARFCYVDLMKYAEKMMVSMTRLRHVCRLR